jgi:chemotaxis protein histidine kinase CheA
MIYQVGVHRLVVEETKKKNNTDNKKKENEINNNNNQNEEKKVENENEQKEKEKEKNEKVNNISEKKLKKVKTKKKVEDNNEETKEGEKKVKKKKIKKKKTEVEGEVDDKEKDDQNKEEGIKSEKSVKRVKLKKKVKKKAVDPEIEGEDKEKEKKDEKEGIKEIEDKEKEEENIKENKEENKDDEKKEEIELQSNPQNYTGFVTYETVFDFLIYNYYSIEMDEFNLTLEDLRSLPSNSSFIRPIEKTAVVKDEVHSSFSNYITSKNDLLPILTEDKKDLYGFLYLRDYLYFISNCESNQALTNEQFLMNMYEDIDDNKPYGKERILYLLYNDETKKYRIKDLLEKINAAPEKKIVIRFTEENQLYIISLNSIFNALVEKNNI